MSVHSEAYENLTSELLERFYLMVSDNGNHKDIKRMDMPKIVYQKIRPQTFGRCQYNRRTNECTIILNSRYADKYKDFYIDHIIPHEIGHAIDYTYNKKAVAKGYRAHGAIFKKIGRVLGYEFTTKIDSDLYGVVVDKTPTRKLKRYVLKCSCCGNEQFVTKAHATKYKYRHKPEFCTSEKGGLYEFTGEIRIIEK